MDTSIRAAILSHARAEYPREACGLLVAHPGGKTAYRPCRNAAEAKSTDHFILHPEDYAAAEDSGKIVGVVHSHPDARPTPSMADRVACEATGMPWHIVSVPGEEWAQIIPEGYQAPLIGRIWCHGVLDCYGIVRDWYKWERGITLPDFAREDNWWHKGGNLYLENFSKAGFVRVMDGSIQHGDVLLMQVLANVTNHAAIYLDGGLILHHLHNRLSSREVFGGYYRKHCTHVLRYSDAPKNPPVG